MSESESNQPESLGTRIKRTEEGKRLFSERSVKTNIWRTWGPYLSERQWGTVREDYSKDGKAWEYFSHDHARSRAYRWGEDGIAGISDNHQILCFAFAFWNKKDPILKERLFGLTNSEGNHGEDVKEVYHYVDNTPTHSYMKYLYRYPQRAFPYEQLLAENRKRDRKSPEYELVDTGVFDEDKYFDIEIEYAKQACDDLLVKVTIHNRATEDAEIVVLPTLWFRNSWSWAPNKIKPSIVAQGDGCVRAFKTQKTDGTYEFDMRLYAKDADGVLFCENETNLERLHWGKNEGVPKKDGINDHIVHGNKDSFRTDQGTKASFQYNLVVPARSSKTILLRLSKTEQNAPFADHEQIVGAHAADANAFYEEVFRYKNLEEDEKRIVRQAYAGMLWSKQYYNFVIEDWLNGDSGPKPPQERLNGRNSGWLTLYNDDIITMPDKWEYCWYATWDLAFHTVTLATIDPDFAKYQLRLFTCEWYMHPSGQLPAYEWNFDDVNPPVHAWACWRVFQIERDHYGSPDWNFLKRVHAKLLMYFTWWTNRKDAEGNNLFEGGFLGLDNISALDRSNLNLAGNAILEQSDGTTSMGIFCLNMLRISIELAKKPKKSKEATDKKDDNTQEVKRGSVFSDIAYKFFQHFLLIARALNTLGLWDEDDGFYYDVLKVPRNTVVDPPAGCADPVKFRMKLRSMVGLLPLAAVETIDVTDLETSDFQERVQWFLENRADLTKNKNISIELQRGENGAPEKSVIHLSLVGRERLEKILARILDPEEFLSEYGLRSLSKRHTEYQLEHTLRTSDGKEVRPRVAYCPAESDSSMFGGNSNWRGPIWFPVNVVIVEALRKHAMRHKGKSLTVELPDGLKKEVDLNAVADEISQRLTAIFALNGKGCRPVFGGSQKYQTDWRDHILFYEYFHGENGAGIGASHQTGWTGQIANLVLKM